MARAKTNENKTRVNLYVDTNVLEYFKHIAETNEQAYQPLMNKVLRDYWESLPPEAKFINQAK